jgi:hypothetical protein
MSTPRLVTPIALAIFLAAGPAAAQTPAEQADRLNQQGKQLFADKDYEGAYNKFREAATLSPEGRFYFNICYALNFLERYQEAIQACEQVEAAGADKELIEKTQRALSSLREKAGQRPATQPASHDQGPRPTGPTSPREPVRPGRPPPPARGPDPFVAGRASGEGSYKWSIGGTVGLLGNLSVGREVQGQGEDREVYGPGGAELRLFANFIVSEAARFGLQGSIGFGALSPGQDSDSDENLAIVDIGGAFFFHLPITRRIVMTPLAGPHLSVQQPQELSQGFITGGVRAEVGFAYVFGRSGEHAFSVTPAVNVYFPATGDVEGQDPSEYGLDLTHSTFALSAGYTYRFSTPFGSTPLITLE